MMAVLPLPVGYRICGVPGLDLSVDDKAALSDRAEPDLVVAFALPLEAAVVGEQKPFELRVKDEPIRRPSGLFPGGGWSARRRWHPADRWGAFHWPPEARGSWF